MSPIKKIQKRDGRIVDFDQERIMQAIWKAAQAVGGTDPSEAEKISNQVTAVLEVFFKNEDEIPTVEQIQDLVEKILIEGGHAKTAKAYIIYRQKRAEEREQKEAILGVGKGDSSLNFSTNALKVLEKRYLLKDDQGNTVETPEDMLRRVARAIAEAEKNYDGNQQEVEEKFFTMMKELEFMPNSPTLMNAGTEIGQLSACFVLPVEDSMEGIFESLKDAALIHKSGGGTGFSFTRLRPSNDLVHSTTGVSSGPVSFMKVFDAATDVIKQGGKRRGANMGILRIDHPDILDFIQMKADMKTLQNFNISVAVTDAFMQALEEDGEYNLINPRDGETVKSIKARMVWDIILSNAWKNGDPGLIFIDEVNRHNMCPHLGDIEATNPCGEQPLLAHESCNLGSINLNKFVNEDRNDMNWDKLRETVHLAVHFLDNVIDVNHYPIEKIAERTRSTRKIGLGVMGFADVLYQLGIKYDSETGIQFGEKVMKFIDSEARKKSMLLAEDRGVFPAYEGSVHDKNGIKMRNTCVTTVAPTGTIGMLAEASGGLEPNFAISFIKNVMDGTELVYTNKYFEEAAHKAGFHSKELMREIAKVGSVQDFDEIPKDIKNVFVTAQDIAPEWHIRMQAAFQKYVDSSVSKTINFPTEAQISDIEDSYKLAYKLGCKGVTIYRDKSREGQVLNIGTVNKKAKAKEQKKEQKSEKKETPTDPAPAQTQQPKATETRQHGKVETSSAQEVELPLVNDQSGEQNAASDSHITSEYNKHAEEFTLPPIQPQNESRSVGAASVMTQPTLLTKKEIMEGKVCPECGTKLQIAEGCMLCLGCGFSACSV
ncbi:vitamin B12-dependent ribonucleotide reductase [Candidatus Peregrinibacteria bacterium]|nr:vitamin B12-dependent ribonucleotide reductase [Candidatus Peregrinibacteria bacterium]